jgi:hypothetical protein
VSPARVSGNRRLAGAIISQKRPRQCYHTLLLTLQGLPLLVTRSLCHTCGRVGPIDCSGVLRHPTQSAQHSGSANVRSDAERLEASRKMIDEMTSAEKAAREKAEAEAILAAKKAEIEAAARRQLEEELAALKSLVHPESWMRSVFFCSRCVSLAISQGRCVMYVL